MIEDLTKELISKGFRFDKLKKVLEIYGINPFLMVYNYTGEYKILEYVSHTTCNGIEGFVVLLKNIKTDEIEKLHEEVGIFHHLYDSTEAKNYIYSTEAKKLVDLRRELFPDAKEARPKSFIPNGTASIVWSVLDFAGRAKDLSENDSSLEFDETKFEDALHEMIRKHDASIGISWETIDFYLMYKCLKK